MMGLVLKFPGVGETGIKNNSQVLNLSKRVGDGGVY